jgi:hypothetical protein
MEKKKKKKKWYDSWWGALYTLAIVDGNPGRGFRRFMEMDRVMGDSERNVNGSIPEPIRPHQRKDPDSCPTTSPANCEI